MNLDQRSRNNKSTHKNVKLVIDLIKKLYNDNGFNVVPMFSMEWRNVGRDKITTILSFHVINKNIQNNKNLIRHTECDQLSTFYIIWKYNMRLIWLVNSIVDDKKHNRFIYSSTHRISTSIHVKSIESLR